jgi:hypothetical protein
LAKQAALCRFADTVETVKRKEKSMLHPDNVPRQ